MHLSHPQHKVPGLLMTVRRVYSPPKKRSVSLLSYDQITIKGRSLKQHSSGEQMFKMSITRHWQGHTPSGSSKGESILAFGGCQHFLACGFITLTSASVVTSPPLLHVLVFQISLWLPLIRKFVFAFGTCSNNPG